MSNLKNTQQRYLVPLKKDQKPSLRPQWHKSSFTKVSEKPNNPELRCLFRILGNCCTNFIIRMFFRPVTGKDLVVLVWKEQFEYLDERVRGLQLLLQRDFCVEFEFIPMWEGFIFRYSLLEQWCQSGAMFFTVCWPYHEHNKSSSDVHKLQNSKEKKKKKKKTNLKLKRRSKMERN